MKKKYLIFTLLALSAIITSLLPMDPYTTNTERIFQKPSWQYLLGTDHLGRDILARVISGLHTSVGLSLGVILMVASLSIAISILATSLHKYFKTLIGFIIDIVHIMPIIVVCLVAVAALGGGAHVLFIGQVLAFLPLTMRVSLKELESVMQQDFVQISRSLGMHPLMLTAKHALPYLLPKLCSQCISLTAVAIGIEGGLSYFGLGITPPHPSLGTLLQDSSKYILTQPLYFVTVATVFLMLLLTLSLLNFTFFQKHIWAVGSPHATTSYLKKLS